MSLIWMPPHTTVPPLRVAANAAGTNAPTGAKINAASSCSGGISSEPPAQTAPRPRAKSCAPMSRAGKGEDPSALIKRQLRDDIRRSAEAVEADPLAVSAEPQCAVADEAGTE